MSCRQGSVITRPGPTLHRPARRPRPHPAPVHTCPRTAGTTPVPPPAPRRRTAHPALPGRPRRRPRERKQLKRAAGRSVLLFSIDHEVRELCKSLWPLSILSRVPGRALWGLLLFVCLTEMSLSLPKSCLRRPGERSPQC